MLATTTGPPDPGSSTTPTEQDIRLPVSNQCTVLREPKACWLGSSQRGYAPGSIHREKDHRKEKRPLNQGFDLIQVIVDRRLGGLALPPIPAYAVPSDLAAAYSVQRGVRGQLMESQWGRAVGYKIACTTPVMQKVVGVPHPCYGTIFDTTVHSSGATLAQVRYHRLGIECEIGVRLGEDLPDRGRAYDQTSVASAVATSLPAMELVDDRYPALPAPDARIFIADDFYGAGAVLGTPAPLAADRLAEVEAHLLVDGQEVGSGTGALVMGHPLRALAWLANTLNQQASELRQGDLVLLGSLVATYWVPPGAHTVKAVHHPLGEVEVRLLP